MKDLLNLEEYSKEFPKLDLIFRLLSRFWYTLEDKSHEEERWDKIRVGSMEVYLDQDKHLCMKFITRFSFENYPEILEFLEQVKKAT